MTDRTLITVGVVGAAVAAVCCFTPLLVLFLGALGLSAWIGWLDYVLLPALAIFAGIAVFGVVRNVRRRSMPPT